jgi:glycerol-3-phosphate acyltransferase PlsY
MTLLLALVGGYLLGSIPFGLLLTRWAGLGDIRQVGSGNIGATNVLRTGKKGLALATLLLDALKGVAAVLVARMLSDDPLVAQLAGLAAFLGHCFPVWLKFNGGKGVATFIGVAGALSWPLMLGVIATWLMIAGLYRISSLAALVAAAASPLFGAILGGPAMAGVHAVMAVVIFVRHKANLNRLIAGQEPRIGAKT